MKNNEPGRENYFYHTSRTAINHRGDPAPVRGREIIAPAREIILKMRQYFVSRYLTCARAVEREDYRSEEVIFRNEKISTTFPIKFN